MFRCEQTLSANHSCENSRPDREKIGESLQKIRDEINRDKICAQQNTRVFNFQCAALSSMLESEFRFILINRCSVWPYHYAVMSPDF